MTSIRTLAPLLIAAALLLSANGMQSTMLALRGLIEGFSPAVIGLLLSAYFAGFIAGCRFAPGLVAGVGHIRAFTAFASIASASALAHAMIVEPAAWLVLRAMTGFSLAALQMILESWLNEIADNKSRGRVLSTYRLTDFVSVTAAQACVGLFNPDQFVPFAVFSIALSLALVPVAMTRVQQPEPPTSARLDLKRLWSVSPLAAAAAVGVGFSASGYWSMAPVFVTGFGYGSAVVGLFVASIIGGGALSQWPIGWISDRVDRRFVLISCAAGTMAVAMLLPVAAGLSQTALICAGILFGVFALPVFGVAVAHANDHAAPGTSVIVNGGLLLLYGGAAICGPVMASFVIGMFGAGALFYLVVGVYGVLVVFSFYRLGQRAAPEAREDFAPVHGTTLSVFELPEEDHNAPTPAEAPEAP